MIKKCVLFACAVVTSAAMLGFTGCDKKPAAPAAGTPAASDPAAPGTPAAPATKDH
jgi:hypothetical protein